MARGAEPIVMAHRGLSSEKAENTIAAFKAAAEAGFQAFEMDLQLTADGEVVVLHDDDLARTTGHEVDIDDIDAAALAGFPTPDGPVPRLADLFDALRATGWNGLWNLEIKAPDAVIPALETAQSRDLLDQVILTCMDSEPLQIAQEEFPAVARGLIALGHLDEADLEIAQALECDWVMADHEGIERQTAAHAKKRGLKLGAWTVNDPARAKELVQRGVEAIITDRRDVLAALRDGVK